MIGIIGFANFRIMQYLYKYTYILDRKGVEYDVIYWNRELDNENIDFNGNCIPFDYYTNSHQPFWKKISGFISYTKFILKTIKKNKYDKLIILTTQVAVPLFVPLMRKYKNKFIYDYRDITKEHFNFYKKMVKKLISSSFFTAISSPGFKNIIGESSKFVLSHNCSNLEVGEINHKQKKQINISFWGIVRNAEYNKKICDALGNDERFNLIYHGEGVYEILQNYCKEQGYQNITFTGKYDRVMISTFAEETDIIHCAYPNDRTMFLAMPVKAYDTVKYAKPIMVTDGSFLSKYIAPYGFSIPIGIDNSNLADYIYESYNLLNAEKLNQGFMDFHNKVKNDDILFEEKLTDFINL